MASPGDRRSLRSDTHPKLFLKDGTIVCPLCLTIVRDIHRHLEYVCCKKADYFQRDHIEKIAKEESYLRSMYSYITESDFKLWFPEPELAEIARAMLTNMHITIADVDSHRSRVNVIDHRPNRPPVVSTDALISDLECQNQSLVQQPLTQDLNIRGQPKHFTANKVITNSEDNNNNGVVEIATAKNSKRYQDISESGDADNIVPAKIWRVDKTTKQNSNTSAATKKVSILAVNTSHPTSNTPIKMLNLANEKCLSTSTPKQVSNQALQTSQSPLTGPSTNAVDSSITCQSSVSAQSNASESTPPEMTITSPSKETIALVKIENEIPSQSTSESSTLAKISTTPMQPPRKNTSMVKIENEIPSTSEQSDRQSSTAPESSNESENNSSFSRTSNWECDYKVCGIGEVPLQYIGVGKDIFTVCSILPVDLTNLKVTSPILMKFGEYIDRLEWHIKNPEARKSQYLSKLAIMMKMVSPDNDLEKFELLNLVLYSNLLKLYHSLRKKFSGQTVSQYVSVMEYLLDWLFSDKEFKMSLPIETQATLFASYTRMEMIRIMVNRDINEKISYK